MAAHRSCFRLLPAVALCTAIAGAGASAAFAQSAQATETAGERKVAASDKTKHTKRNRTTHGRVATYYHDSLQGRRTASGSRYRPQAMTAASPSLPLGTRVKVTNVENDKSVVVEVNDRLPARDPGHVLDLSKGAAQRLDMIEKGKVEVKTEVLSKPEERGR